MKAYIISQFLHRPGRAIGVIGGIALGAALFVALTSLGAGLRQASQAPLAGVAADFLITRPSVGQAASAQRTRGPRLPFGSTPFSPDEIESIKSVEGITEVSATLEIWVFGTNQYQVVLGVNPLQNKLGPGLILHDGLVSGRLFNADEPGVTVVDRHYAALFSLKPGNTVSIGKKDYQVVGIVDQQSGSQAGAANFYISLSEALSMVTLNDGQANQVYARMSDASRRDSVIGDLKHQLGEISVMSQESILQVMGGVLQITTRFSLVASLVGMVGGLGLAWVALHGLITERKREIGVMKAVGWRIRDVIRIFLGEIFVLALLGGLFGIALGWSLSVMIAYLPAPMVSINETLPGLAVGALPSVTDRLTVTVTLNTGLYTVWQSARLKPMQTLKDV